MNDRTDVEMRMLRGLVARRIDRRWEAFAADHPRLAESIERVRLVDSTARRLAEDPAYQRAMDAAGRDEAVLAAAVELMEVVERWVERAVGDF